MSLEWWRWLDPKEGRRTLPQQGQHNMQGSKGLSHLAQLALHQAHLMPQVLVACTLMTMTSNNNNNNNNNNNTMAQGIHEVKYDDGDIYKGEFLCLQW